MDATNSASPLHDAARRNDARCIRHLIRDGHSVNDWDMKGASPLEVAISSNSIDAVRTLLGYGAWPRDSPLGLAAKLPTPDIFQMLVKARFPVGDSLTYDRGLYLSHVAASYGSVYVFDILSKLGHKISPTARSIKNVTLLQYAARHCHKSVFQWFVDRNIPLQLNAYNDGVVGTVFTDAIMTQDVDFVSFLIDLGADVNFIGNSPVPPLVVAIDEHANDIARLLVKQGANLDCYPSLHVPLISAVSSNNTEMVSILVQSGAQTVARNVVQTGAFDALLIALKNFSFGAGSNRLSCLQTMFVHGANAASRSRCCVYAVSSLQFDVVDMMLKNDPGVGGDIFRKMDRWWPSKTLFNGIAKHRATRSLRIALSSTRMSRLLQCSQDELVKQFCRQFYWRKSIVTLFTRALILFRTKSPHTFQKLDAYITSPNILKRTL